MTSWNEYLNVLLLDTGHIRNACIIGVPSGLVYAHADENFLPRIYPADTVDSNGNDMQIYVNELEGWIETARSDWQLPPSGGLRINGNRFTWLGNGEETYTDFVSSSSSDSATCTCALPSTSTSISIKYAKGQFGGNRSVCLCGSPKTMIVATSDRSQGHDFSQCIQNCTRLAAYLTSVGH